MSNKMEQQTNTAPPPILVQTNHQEDVTDHEMIQRIKKYYPNQKFTMGKIAAVLTGPFLGALGYVHFVHHDDKEITI